MICSKGVRHKQKLIVDRLALLLHIPCVGPTLNSAEANLP